LAAPIIRNASTRAPSRSASNARNAMKASSCAAEFRADVAPAASSMAAAAIRTAISPRRTSRSTSPAQNVPRPSSLKSAPSREISAPASRKAAIGKLKRRPRQKPQPRRPLQRRLSQRQRRPSPISFTHKNPRRSALETNPKVAPASRAGSSASCRHPKRSDRSLSAFHRNYVFADSVAARAATTPAALGRPGIAHTNAPSATITGKHSIT
jgi:hypothetical protein